jgi:hypothetical protein
MAFQTRSIGASIRAELVISVMVVGIVILLSIADLP